MVSPPFSISVEQWTWHRAGLVAFGWLDEREGTTCGRDVHLEGAADRHTDVNGFGDVFEFEERKWVDCEGSS